MSIPEEVKKLVISWKLKYGSIYLSEIDGISIIYRGLTVREMLTLQSHGMVDEIFDLGIVHLCVLYPDSLEFKKEGNYCTLSQQIRESSGWESPNAVVDLIQEKKEKLKEDTLNFICNQLASFFGFTQEHVENMTLDLFASHCAMYELATGKSFFKSNQNKKMDVLQKLGVVGESPVDMPRPISREEFLRKQAMDSATNALRYRITAEKGASPPSVFDWEQDLKQIKEEMAR